MYDKGRAILFTKAREAEVREIRLAETDENTVVVKTILSGISTGTEMSVYTGAAAGEGVTYPCVPGYEEVGEVVYAGPGAPKTNAGETLKVGDRVMANEVRFYPDYTAAWGGQCEYAIKNARTGGGATDRPAKIPDNVSYQEAVIAYLACVAKKGLDMVGVNEGESFLVIGTGNVGLSAIQLLKARGIRDITAADINPERLRLAGKYTDRMFVPGTAKAMKEFLDLNEGKRVDVVVECSGDPAAVNTVFDYVKPRGRVHLQGQYRQPVIITNYARWNCRDLSVSASIAISPGDKEAVLDLISKGKFDAKSLYTDIYDVEDAPRAYQELEENRDILKILLKWND